MSVSRHTTYNLLGSIIPLILALVTVPVYLKLVGAERYGVLAIAWLLLGYFGLFDLGLGRATSFRIAALQGATAQARADTFWAALIVNFTMGVVGGVGLWAAAGYFFAHVFKVDEHLRPEIVAAVPLLAAAVPIATLTGVLTGALQAREKFLEVNIISVTSTTLFQLFPLALAWLVSPDLKLLLSAAVAARVLALCVLGYRCYVELAAGQQRRLVADEVPLLLKYGGWVTLTSIFGPMLVMSDRFAIGTVLGAAAVATYSVAYQISQRISVLPSALTTALFPKLSAGSPEEQKALGEKALLMLSSLISFPVLGAIYLIGPFLHVWTGHEIGADAAPIGRVLLVAFWANSFALLPYTRLQAAGRPDLVTKVLIAQIPPYFVVLYLGMTYFGLWGCAAAFVIRCIADYILLTWVSGRDFKQLPLLAANLGLLMAGVFISDRWSLTDGRWWLSASLLAAVTATIGWRTLPLPVQSQVVALTRRFARIS